MHFDITKSIYEFFILFHFQIEFIVITLCIYLNDSEFPKQTSVRHSY